MIHTLILAIHGQLTDFLKKIIEFYCVDSYTNRNFKNIVTFTKKEIYGTNLQRRIAYYRWHCIALKYTQCSCSKHAYIYYHWLSLLNHARINQSWRISSSNESVKINKKVIFSLIAAFFTVVLIFLSWIPRINRGT